MFGRSSAEQKANKIVQLSVQYTGSGTANATDFRKAVENALSAHPQYADLSMALLTNKANASVKSLVEFEPREKDYDAAAKVFEETGDANAALEAGKGARK